MCVYNFVLFLIRDACDKILVCNTKFSVLLQQSKSIARSEIQMGTGNKFPIFNLIKK